MDASWTVHAIFVCISLVVFATSQDPDEPCAGGGGCGECISAHPSCAWCRQKDFSVNGIDKPRCGNISSLLLRGCGRRYISDPEPFSTIIRNEPPTDVVDGDDQAIQLAPQQVAVKLRPKVPHAIDVTFRQAKDFPVDLYFIMDLSKTMEPVKKNIYAVSDTLASEMRKITANFKLGFGSYVDKKRSPFVDIRPDKLLRPCDNCVPTYLFKNHVSLTNDADKFKKTISSSNVSSNLDSPEGTLDALMQATVCKEEIGWRQVSRKILLVLTDNGYHYAGDGRLAGLVKPNDGFCHLDSNNEYNSSVLQDYPSVGHIAHVLAREDMNVIFAIYPRLRNTLPEYEALARLIEGAVAVKFRIAGDTSSIVHIIKDSYEKLSGTVELRHEAPGGVDVTYMSSCLGGDPRNTSVCDGLKVRDQVTFQVTLSAPECPANPVDRHQMVTIAPAGLMDKLTIDVHVDCSCPCEHQKPDDALGVLPAEPNSAQCNGMGTYQCGACKCNPGWSGQDCSCITDRDDLCTRPGSTEVCGGRGTCECGQCRCHALSLSDVTKVYKGKYCECDDYSCDNYGGNLCGGEGRGTCKCGICECRPGHTGRACNCPISQESCIADGLICSGHGTCECGKCKCDSKYQGPTCNMCPACPGPCEMNRPCVQCVGFSTGPYVESECANCTHVHPVSESLFNRDETADTLMCKYSNDDKCNIYFTFSRRTGDVQVNLEPECPKPVNKVGIIAGVVGAITMIGITLLFVWKFVVTIYDRREFEKFEHERNTAKWNKADNPIYKPSTSTFANPAYSTK